jgi:hypothetical protein
VDDSLQAQCRWDLVDLSLDVESGGCAKAPWELRSGVPFVLSYRQHRTPALRAFCFAQQRDSAVRLA